MSQVFTETLSQDSLTQSKEDIENSLDALRSSFSGTSRPTSPTPVAGQFFYNTDTSVWELYDGSSWSVIPAPDGSGNLSVSGDITLFVGTAKEFESGSQVLQNSSTGLYSFGGMTINGGDDTQVDIAAGKGHIVNFHDDPLNPTYDDVEWDASTITISAVATNDVTYILKNNDSGTFTQQLTFPTQEEVREKIFLGRAIHIGGAVVTVQNTPYVLSSPFSQTAEILNALGIVNENISITNNGSNLSIDCSGGKLLVRGAGFVSDNANPNEATISASSPQSFAYITQAAGSTGSSTTDIVPGSYDVSGTITAIPGSGNRASVQRVYIFPSGNVRIAYGQEWYDNLSESIQAVNTESFTTNPNVKPSDGPANGVLVATICLTKSCTDLSDTSECRILPASKFGEIAVGGSGQSITTIQQAYNNSTDGNVTTDATRGSLEVQRGSGADTDVVLEVKNGAGSSTHTITGEGACSGLSFLSGDGTVGTVAVGVGATDTGLYSSAAGSVDIGCAGSSPARFTAGAFNVLVDMDVDQDSFFHGAITLDGGTNDPTILGEDRIQFGLRSTEPEMTFETETGNQAWTFGTTSDGYFRLFFPGTVTHTITEDETIFDHTGVFRGNRSDLTTQYGTTGVWAGTAGGTPFPALVFEYGGDDNSAFFRSQAGELVGFHDSARVIEFTSSETTVKDDLVVEGILQEHKRAFVDISSSQTLLTTDSGKYHYVVANITLPPAALNLIYYLKMGPGPTTYEITSSSGDDVIMPDGAYADMENDSGGEFIVLVGISSSQWRAFQIEGTFNEL